MSNRFTRIALAATAALALGGLAALGGCAPQEPATASDAGAESASTEDAGEELVSWSPDADCTACHAKEASSTDASGCLAQAHVQLGYACVDCHADEQGLAAVHADGAAGTPAGKLKATNVAESTCLSCHDSREAIAETTADVEIVDDKGTGVNPHALPASTDHDALVCTDCHVSHEAKPALEEAEGICASCHHAGVFECGTCHS